MAKGIITVHVGEWKYSRWQKKFASHFNQPNVRIAIHQVYADMSKKYVPYKTGALRSSVRVTKNYIRWGGATKKVRYAHYMYEGVVYGPNIPIYEGKGDKRTFVGFRSPRGEGSKHPTGEHITYHTPGTRDHWDKAVFENEMRGFKWRVTHELKKIAKEEGW